MLYFDNATASPPSKGVLEAIKKAGWISPFSLYGEKEVRSLNQAFEQIDKLFPTQGTGSLFFAPSRMAAMDALFRFVFEEWGRGFGKSHFLTSQIEEATQIFALSHLEDWGGKGTLIATDRDDRLTAERLQAALSPRTSLLTLSLGHGLLGTLQPIDELYPLLDERGVLLHLDLSHVVGKAEVDPLKLRADFITFSLETIHGPRGAAVLWSKRPLRSNDLLFGSEPQAIGMMDLPRCLGLGVAALEARDHLSTLQLEGSLMREQFEEELKKAIPEIEILFKGTERLPTTSVISFPGVRSEALLFSLHEKGLFASMGGGIFQEISHLLTACHYPPEIALTSLSFTFSRMNTREEISEGVKILEECYFPLRKASQGLL
jgi:cysteine desulfurase